MPRRPRVVLPGVPLHLIQRGNNRQACFFTDDDYRFYLEWLQTYARDAGCAVHAHVLMTNHVHLLLTPSTAESTGELMKRLGQRYVQYVNRTYRRSGTLWEGRFRSCLTQEESYVLGCYRYIELNPVRAGMVAHPGDYRWSSYRANAQGEACSGLRPHDCYLALGTDKGGRQAAYRELFRYRLDPGLVDEIRAATNGNYALGSPRFEEQVARAVGRRVVRRRSGRPKKQAETATDDLFRGD
jgi:putative transposase